MRLVQRQSDGKVSHWWDIRIGVTCLWVHWESEQHKEQRYQATCSQLVGGNCHTHNASSMYRVSFSFLPKEGRGGRMRLYGLLGGGGGASKSKACGKLL